MYNIHIMTTLQQETYELLKTVPRGKITTYKAPTVPCHRVVASDGTIGGFMGKRTGLSILPLYFMRYNVLYIYYENTI